MTVSSILNEKGQDVFTVPAQITLLDATVALKERGVGAVVVVDSQDHAVGILSERDVVRALASQGPGVLDRAVADFMTANIITCGEDDSLDSIMEVMTEKRIRHIPVLTEGRLMGIVSIGDVVRIKIARAEAEAAALKSYIMTG